MNDHCHMRGIAEVLGLALFLSHAIGQQAAEGIAEYESGKLADAERSLRSASASDPKDERARYYLVLTLSEQNKLEEAEAALKPLEESAPDSAYTRLAAARLYIARREFDRAETALKDAAKANDGDGDLLFLRGLLNAARKNYRPAVQDLEASIDKRPRNAYAHYYAGLAYNGLKRPDKMVEHFEHFLRLAPDAPEAGKVRAVLKAVR